jgi:hypothetical protein
LDDLALLLFHVAPLLVDNVTYYEKTR